MAHTLYNEKPPTLKVGDTSSLQDHSPTCQLRITLESNSNDKENSDILQCCEQLQVATANSETVPVATNMSSSLPVATNTNSLYTKADQSLPPSESIGLHVAMNTINPSGSPVSLVSPMEITPIENYEDDGSTSSSGTIIMDIPPSDMENPLVSEKELNITIVEPSQESLMVYLWQQMHSNLQP